MPLPRSGIKYLWIVLVIVLVVGAWLLSSLFQTDAFNVRATIKDFPPGVAQTTAAWSGPSGTQDTGLAPGSVPDETQNNGTEPGSVPDGAQDKGTEPGSEPGGSGYKEPEPEPELQGSGDNGSQPGPLLGGSLPPLVVQISGQGNPISVSTVLIDYGLVFPGESLTRQLVIELTGDDTQITYTITLLEKSPYEDMRPYLTVEKATEDDSEDDEIADWPTCFAQGTLTADSDESDTWWVTFDVPDEPDEFGEYQADILVDVPD